MTFDSGNIDHNLGRVNQGMDGNKKNQQEAPAEEKKQDTPQADTSRQIDANAMLDLMAKNSMMIAGQNVEHVSIVEGMAKFESMFSPEEHEKQMADTLAVIDDEFPGLSDLAKEDLAEMTIANGLTGIPTVNV